MQLSISRCSEKISWIKEIAHILDVTVCQSIKCVFLLYITVVLLNIPLTQGKKFGRLNYSCWSLSMNYLRILRAY